MPAADISTLQTLNAQIDAVENQLVATPPGPAHDMLAAQVVMLHAQAKAATDQIAAQQAATNNIFQGVSILSGLGLLAGSTGATPITTIISLFRK